MLEVVERYLEVPHLTDVDAPDPRGGYNIKPTNQVSCIIADTHHAKLTSARWWFVPSWAKDDWKQTTFNARIETAHQKPTFRTAWQHHRCAIPALGYYEWTGAKGNKTPWYLSAKTNAPCLFFAGLYSWREDISSYTTTILTREALPQIEHIHTRSPVLLLGNEVMDWVRGNIGTVEAQDSLGTGFDGQMTFHRVQSFGRDDDGPALIDPFDTLI